jgi:hypothetical protein
MAGSELPAEIVVDDGAKTSQESVAQGNDAKQQEKASTEF